MAFFYQFRIVSQKDYRFRSTNGFFYEIRIVSQKDYRFRTSNGIFLLISHCFSERLPISHNKRHFFTNFVLFLRKITVFAQQTAFLYEIRIVSQKDYRFRTTNGIFLLISYCF